MAWTGLEFSACPTCQFSSVCRLDAHSCGYCQQRNLCSSCLDSGRLQCMFLSVLCFFRCKQVQGKLGWARGVEGSCAAPLWIRGAIKNPDIAHRHKVHARPLPIPIRFMLGHYSYPLGSCQAITHPIRLMTGYYSYPSGSCPAITHTHQVQARPFLIPIRFMPGHYSSP